MEEAKIIKENCKRYGYECIEMFDRFYVKAKWESWYIVPKGNGHVCLLHENTRKSHSSKNDYHTQKKDILLAEVFAYICRHGKWKYERKPDTVKVRANKKLRSVAV